MLKITWPIFVKENKYTKWYQDLIEKVQSRVLPEGTYTERHHIIPVSLGGDKGKDNTVVLTAREHYIAHALLWKISMEPKYHNKMTMALNVMVNGSGHQKQDRSYLVNSKVYESHRKELSKILSEKMKGPANKFRGKKHSEESLAKIREANVRTKDIRSQKAMGEKNPMFGKKHDEETLKRIAENCKNWWDEEKKKKASELVKSRWQDPEWKKKALESRKNSEGWKNRDWVTANNKAAATRKERGYKPSEETKKKQSETRKAKLATGEIVPWNKGKKIGCFRSKESMTVSAKKAHQTRKANLELLKQKEKVDV